MLLARRANKNKQIQNGAFRFKLTVLSSLDQRAYNITVAAICLQNLHTNNDVVNI